MVGTLDIQRALADGVKAYEPGLLAAAHRGVLYVDEVNLLPDHLVDLLLDAAAMGRAHVERDGVSVKHAARFLLVGTMNPEEGEPRPQLVDRFGLVVTVTAPRDPVLRAEVVRRRLAYELDPDGFAARFAATEKELAAQIVAAQQLLPAVTLPDRELDRIARICLAYGVDGMRADIVVARCAVALAAWHGRIGGDRRGRGRRGPAGAAAPAAQGSARPAGHRRAAAGRRPERGRVAAAARGGPGRPGAGRSGAGAGRRRAAPSSGPAAAGASRAAATRPTGPAGRGDERRRRRRPPTIRRRPALTPASDALRRPRPGPLSGRVRCAIARRGEGGHAGRRSPAFARRGRVVGSREPRGKLAGAPHLPATLRAALHRGAREVRPADLREAVHVGREANLVLFVVDASGSMAARKRMTVVKTAVLSLLRDAYQRRDRIGMITFRGHDAEQVLPPTSSHEVGVLRLAALRTGGRTPLAAGLRAAAATIATERRRDPRRRPLLIVVTDGRATSGPDPVTVAPLLDGVASRGRRLRVRPGPARPGPPAGHGARRRPDAAGDARTRTARAA